MPLGADNAGFYSTAPLEKTLTELVDFSLINRQQAAPHGRRRSRAQRAACAISTATTEIDVEHIMASGALPPAFPAVRIDGELYWDGGILSNTPTEAIFDENPRRQLARLCRAHVEPRRDPSPNPSGRFFTARRTFNIRAASRSHIARQAQIHRLRHVIRELAMLLPEERARQRQPCASLPATAASRACMSCACYGQDTTTRTTPRTSISVHPASASGGGPATRRQCARSKARRGRASSIRSRASSCTS